MTGTRLRSRLNGRGRPGFTIAEMLLSFVLASVLLGAFYRIMLRQGRGYSQIIVSGDADETARSAAAILASELRQATVGGGILVGTLDAQSITVRSIQGVGVVCAKSAAQPAFAIWRNAGNIQPAVNDTALFYAFALKTWRKLTISAVGTPAYYSMTSCNWAGGRAPDLVVEVAGFTATDTTGILVGSPFRTYRQVQYGVYQANGRYWLGRKVSPSTGSYQVFTGPLRGSTGLRFTYYDASGAVTTTASQVASVKVTVLSESYKQYRTADGTLQYCL